MRWDVAGRCKLVAWLADMQGLLHTCMPDSSAMTAAGHTYKE
jgi:hypothetical protein